MSELDDSLLGLVDSVVDAGAERLPLLTLREARAAGRCRRRPGRPCRARSSSSRADRPGGVAAQRAGGEVRCRSVHRGQRPARTAVTGRPPSSGGRLPSTGPSATPSAALPPAARTPPSSTSRRSAKQTSGGVAAGAHRRAKDGVPQPFSPSGVGSAADAMSMEVRDRLPQPGVHSSVPGPAGKLWTTRVTHNLTATLKRLRVDRQLEEAVTHGAAPPDARFWPRREDRHPPRGPGIRASGKWCRAGIDRRRHRWPPRTQAPWPRRAPRAQHRYELCTISRRRPTGGPLPDPRQSRSVASSASGGLVSGGAPYYCAGHPWGESGEFGRRWGVRGENRLRNAARA